MNIQQSFDNEKKGKLYIVPTPIGNLEDITFRALNILRSVSIIAAEDTRNSKKLLNHFDISTPLISYHEHNKLAREEQLLRRLENHESIAIVSDAGMPAISDPGHELIQAAIEQEFSVVVLPGANAALCALIGSGLPANEFYFYGFLPRKKKDKEAELERLQRIQASLLFYESPYRIKETLKAAKSVLGNRRVVLARELSKRFEEYIRGTLNEVITYTKDIELKGEFCMVIDGTDQLIQETSLWWDGYTIVEHVDYYIDEKDMPSKEAIKLVAKERKLPKREVYQAYHIED
ncbi:16S rRNA (cytidine(1402)-2'-O)-methyltransferase [Agaribacter marinus]|uniref:Ribosomal RNA small subunit methyltransferase I n=1 Tax=Virgibacillus salarius TaxID=447199 RepID=A0A941I9H2_9BACI|nr:MULTISPECIES: 16S rRNA (cytidine(1402)-2'-O)-methyltransferase [Bacillaceae]MBR7796774.1 16S rRNA (cytidine(1402)-2'-O)-methyltransferase [Virgibacillus salarius]MDY7045095.1 16S rRNA (cytidine(1402)-2'-O)-methyltransferase [Virgibacillus sp. M23]NAZ09484.1 16S rRNA (cytidine(1402)-2'-O)-methyltransferase [Agaribacter marinus]